MIKVVGIRFKRACKVNEYECGAQLGLQPGDFVIVEVEKGLGMGTVAYTPKEPNPQTKPRSLRKVLRKADEADMERLKFNARREKESLTVCTEKIKAYGLPMKLVRAEYLFDSSKAIFYFTSDSRVDFRRLVKDLASYFHTRIEMRQIGVRDEAKMLGGIGPCGRELCCSSFLPDFTPVTIKMAKQQNLALNPAKISGVCGRLMCCLSYEHEGYSGSAGKGRRGRKPCAERAAEAGRRPDNNRRAGTERAADKKRRPGNNRGADNKDNNRRSGGDRRPRGERAAGNESQRSNTKRTGSERRPDNERAAGRDRKQGDNRRPDNAKRTGNDRRPDNERAAGSNRKPGNNRRPDNAGRTGNERRPGNNRRPDNTKRADNNRRPDNERRPGGEKRQEKAKKPADNEQS